MAIKLKSITRLIPWSLALRAVLFGAAWLILPFWAFSILALYLYFVPLFQPLKLGVPFATLLFFTYTLTPNIWFAILLLVIFYLILGMKDLILIDRIAAYEILVLLLLFLVFFGFFSWVTNLGIRSAPFKAVLPAGLFFFLARGFLYYPDSPPPLLRVRKSGRWEFLFIGLGAFMIWQLSLVLLFLPMSFFYQSALLFLVTLFFLELFPYHLRGELSRERILVNFSTFFILGTVILAAIEWSI